MRRTTWILALAAGYLNALTLLYLGGVFAGVATANLLLTGITTATDPHHLTGTAARAALAVAVYAATIHATRHQPPGRCLLAELAALCTLTAGWAATHHDPHGPAQLPLLTLAAIAMALQAAAHRDADTPTGSLTGPLIRTVKGHATTAQGEEGQPAAAGVVQDGTATRRAATGDILRNTAPLAALPAGAAAAAYLLDHDPWLGPLPAVALIATAVVVHALPPRRNRRHIPATPRPQPAPTP